MAGPATILLCLLVGPLTATSYQSVKEQTDDTPHLTSIGERTRKGGVAVSQDLLCGVNKKCRRNVKLVCNPAKIHYGDHLYVPGMGLLQVNDCMGLTKLNRETGARTAIKRSIDVWVGSWEEEKKFDQTHGIKKWAVYRVQLNEK